MFQVNSSDNLNEINLPMGYQNKTADMAAYLSVIFTGWMFLVLVINNAGFVLKTDFIHYSFFISLGAAIGISYWLKGFLNIKGKHLHILNLLFLLSIGAFTLLSCEIYDVSYDGLSYHKQAVIQILKGYNPFYEQVGRDVFDAVTINHYPKATWIISASVASATNVLESGKMINLSIAVASFFALLTVLIVSSKFPVWQSVILSLITAFNPIVICQLFTSCVDGFLSGLFLILLSGLYLILFSERKRSGYILTVLAVILISNVKFTGLVYAVAILFFAGILFLICNGTKRILMYLTIFIGSVAVAVLFVGYNPYVINTVTKHYPFYPLNKVNVLEGHSPLKFEKMNRFEKFYSSLFSESNNIFPPKRNFIKKPFSIRYDPEVTIFKENDVRMAGFGPLFSGCTIITLVLYLVSLFLNRKNIKSILIQLFCISAILTTVFVHDAGWWARFVPQFYLLIVMIAILNLSGTHSLFKYFSIIPVLLLILNSALILNANWSNVLLITKQSNAQIRYLKSLERLIYIKYERIWFNGFEATLYRLREKGLNFKVVNDFSGNGYLETGSLINGKEEVRYAYEIPEKTASMKEATLNDFDQFLSTLPDTEIKKQLTESKKDCFLLFQNSKHDWRGKEKLKSQLYPLWIKYKENRFLY